MIGAAFLSIAGNLSAMMVAALRMTFAMARMNMMPISLGRAHVKYATPANSIVLFGVLGLVLAVTGSFIRLALMSSLARLLGYALSIGALPTIRRVHPDGTRAFTLPGGMLFPIVALGVCLVLASQASVTAWIVTGVFVLIGSLLYYYSSRNAALKVK